MTSLHRIHKGVSLFALERDYVVIDIETTGLSPSFDKIIEIAALKVRDDEIVDQFQCLVNPGHEISIFIQNLTGITNDMLRTAPSIDAILPDFRDFIGDHLLLGHNVSFDVNFLYDAFMESLSHPLSNDFVDTLRISRRENKDLENHRLVTIAEYFKIDYPIAHRALEDCLITHKIFMQFKYLINQKYGSLETFLNTTKRSPWQSTRLDIRNLVASNDCETNPNHMFFNKSFVFTGALSIPRSQAAQMVIDVGGLCENGVTKKTNYLVVGNLDYVRNLKGSKSSKIIKAESLILIGQDLMILSEDDFFQYLTSGEEM